MGVNEENGLLEVRRGIFSTQLVTRSRPIHDMNRVIMENGRIFPKQWMSLDAPFLRGIYHAILRGNVFFYDVHLYHLVVFIRLVLYPTEKSPDKNKNGLRVKTVLKEEEKERHSGFTLVYTDAATSISSAICEGIPISSFPL